MADNSSSTDRELLAEVAQGNPVALRELYGRHAPWLSIRLTRRCNNQDVVADVLQDTFVAVWKGAARFRSEGDVAAWFWGIAVRRLVSRLRRVAGSAEAPYADVDPGTELAAEDKVLLGVEFGDLGAALASLSPEMRAVVQATVLDGLTTKEASQLLGIPQNTVKTRLHRAKAHLRHHLIEGIA